MAQQTQRSVWRDPQTGDPFRILHFREDRLHRDWGPAVVRVERTPHGLRPSHAEWWADGQRTRAAGPAWIAFDTLTGAPKEERWLRHEDLHRENGPAVVGHDPRGRIREEWWRNGKAYLPTLPERARWNATKARQGGPWHRDSTQPLWAQDLAWQPKETRLGPAGAKRTAAKAPVAKPGGSDLER